MADKTKIEFNLEEMVDTKVLESETKSEPVKKKKQMELDPNPKKRKAGRPKGSVSKWDPTQSRILKLKPGEATEKVLSKYHGPETKTILFVDLLYQGASKEDAIIEANKERDENPLRSPKNLDDTILKAVSNERTIAYMQLLNEGILNPIHLKENYPQIKFDKNDFKNVDLFYGIDMERESFRKLIRFYRLVIMKRVIKGEGCFISEEESLQSILSRSATGSADDLKKILWRKISNPHKTVNPQIVKQYMELCNMTDANKQLDTNITIKFEPFNEIAAKVVEKEENEGE